MEKKLTFQEHAMIGLDKSHKTLWPQYYLSDTKGSVNGTFLTGPRHGLSQSLSCQSLCCNGGSIRKLSLGRERTWRTRRDTNHELSFMDGPLSSQWGMGSAWEGQRRTTMRLARRIRKYMRRLRDQLKQQRLDSRQWQGVRAASTACSSY